MEEPAATVVVVLLVLSLLIALAGASLRWTPPGHVLVLSRRGVVRRVAGGGPVWRWPLLDTVAAVPTTAEPVAVSVRASTRDGHDVRLLAEAVLPVVPPRPGEPADAVAQARERAEAGLAAELVAAVAACDVADLDGLRVRGLAVDELDVVLR